MAHQALPDVTGSSAPAPAPEAQPAWRSALNTASGFILKQREASILLIAVVLIVYFQIQTNGLFLQSSNIPLLSQYTAATAIIAAGEVFLLICGEIDLSAGNVFAFAPFIMYFTNQAGFPLFIGVIVALLTSAAVGLINGLVTVFLRVPSFITTLGTLFLLNGVTLIISNDFPINTPSEDTGFSHFLGQSAFSEIIWAVLIVVALQVLLNLTPWGLHTVATGSNAVGSSEVGVDTNRIRIVSFISCSVLAGFAGILEAYRITSMQPLAGGTGIMFNAVAGAVIGGTALNGGSGTVVGALLGVFVISLIQDGFTLLGVNANYFYLVLGGAILLAMVFNVRLQQLRRVGRE